MSSKIICGCKNISFKAPQLPSWVQNLISISPSNGCGAFLLAASQGVIADAELESVGLSTLHSCTASQLTVVGSALQVDAALMLETSTTSGASPQKPAAVPWENVPTEHSGLGGTYQWGRAPGPPRARAASCRISMWLLCQRCCSRGASAVPQSDSLQGFLQIRSTT